MDKKRFLHYKKKLILFVLLGISSVVLTGCQKLPFLQKNQTGGLQINTENGPASVFLNGEYANKTPYIDKNLKVGTYAVKIEPDDKSLSPYETSINIYPDTLAVVNWTPAVSIEESGGVIFEMEPLSRKSSALSITSIPDSTIVNIDDEPKGFSPVLVEEISAGDHNVKISLPSYITQEHSVSIVEGMKMHMMVKLAKIKNASESAGLLEASDEATATESAQATSSATSSPKASSSPRPTTASSTSSATIAKPYVRILETPTNFLRVRDEASSNGAEVAQVKPGETFKFFQTSNGWHEIEYQTGKKGWVSGQYAEVVK